MKEKDTLVGFLCFRQELLWLPTERVHPERLHRSCLLIPHPLPPLISRYHTYPSLLLPGARSS